MSNEPPKPPDVLNRFVQMVLSYKPKPKTKPAKTRMCRARKIAKEQQESNREDA